MKLEIRLQFRSDFVDQLSLQKVNQRVFSEESSPSEPTIPPNYLLLDSAPNVGPLISHWEINKFEDC